MPPRLIESADYGNSGIHFRSEPRPNFDIWGYQADFDTNHDYTGFLCQHGRGLVAGRGQEVVIDEAGRKVEFKDLRIREFQPRAERGAPAAERAAGTG